MLAELWNDLRYRLRALTRGGDLDREMEDEIQAHLAREADALERRGLPASEARRQARLAFGGLENVREQSRDMRGTRRLEDHIQDVSYAWRRIRRSPALSLTIVALLALTIGSATLVFSVVNAVLLRPLPFGDPDRLALVWETRANTAQNVVGGHEFPEWARSNRTFDGLSPMIYDEGIHLTGAGDPVALLGVRVAATFFQVMGVAPAIGRTFTADEDSEGRGDVVALSTRAFFKASVVAAVFAAAAIAVYADDLIRLAATDAFLGARVTLWLLAASIPLSAMTAPLTAVMKSLDGVRAALVCDLAWACAYLSLMLVLASRLGVAGAGVAQLAACLLQLGIAVRLAAVKPRLADALASLAKTLLCAAAAFAPAVLAQRLGAPRLVTWPLVLLALWIYVRVARRLRVLAADERARLVQTLQGHGLARGLAWWMP